NNIIGVAHGIQSVDCTVNLGQLRLWIEPCSFDIGFGCYNDKYRILVKNMSEVYIVNENGSVVSRISTGHIQKAIDRGVALIGKQGQVGIKPLHPPIEGSR